MNKTLICIECPKGCSLKVTLDDNRVVSVEGNQCAKGQEYATTEFENPKRLVTSTVLANNLSIKMIPVRTDKPVAKDKVLDVVDRLRKVCVNHPVRIGEVIVENVMGLNVNIIATRQAKKES